MQRDPSRIGFGVALPTSGPFATAANILRVATQVGEYGFDDVWVNDHYSYPRQRLTRSSAGSIEAVTDQEPHFFESLTTLAVVGGALPRIGLAVHGLILPIRDPRLFAKQIATIDALTGNRLTVAPGIGGSREDFEPAGVPFNRRGRLLDEYLAVLEAITTQEHPVSFTGECVSFEGATFYPRPSNVQLWITGDSEPALRRVVRWASGWFSSGWPRHEAYRQLGQRLDQLASEAGRDPRSIVRATDPFCCVAATREEAYQIATPSLVERFGSLDRALVLCAIGSAADVQEQLQRLIDVGLGYFELRFICHSMASYLEMIRRVAEDVVPTLRN
ncbi:MAG: TIGR03619 family F420-dependent LLM class oxidoreductase [Chloroflexota bacterium]|nr:TIGR03619 family F420-dependent LLM class oxidoreductase [Chloroflexota bacterium]